jgi:hypothetical protein
MVKGCVYALLLFAALIAGYIYWLEQTLDWPESWIAGGIAGFIVLCCIGALMNARIAWRDWGRLAAARREEPLYDGRVVAACGTIHPVRESLVAPFSGAECVICEYELSTVRRDAKSKQDSSTVEYAGFLMTPCVVRTSRGEIKLLGFPVLEGISERPVSGPAAEQNAYNYLMHTEFEDRSGLKVVTVFGAFDEAFTDDDGLVQKNLRLSSLRPQELFPHARDEATDAGPSAPQAADDDWAEEEEEEFEDDELDDQAEKFAAENEAEPKLFPAGRTNSPKLTEKRIAAGEAVCVFGEYNELSRGLLPSSSLRPNRLFRGTLEKQEARARTSLMSNLMGGLIGLAVVHGAIFGGLALYRNSPEFKQKEEERKAQEAAAAAKWQAEAEPVE